MADNKPYGDVKYADPKNGKYPIDTEAHARAAWAYINMPKNAAMYPLNGVTLSEVKGRIAAACKKFGIDISDGDSDSGSSRADSLPFVRSFPLKDIAIQTGAGADGRTVDAYAAIFDTPAAVHDQDGEYIEVIDPRAFDRILPTLAPGGDKKSWRCGVFYNHGLTIHGTPSGDNLPIGIPLDIRVDGHGLFTRTRYHKGAEIDRILEAISEGSLQAYSFSGRFRRSQPVQYRGRKFGPDRAGNLPTVRRLDSTLREYGPTPFPVYSGAEITGVRAEQITEQLAHITELLRSGAPLDTPPDSGAPEWDTPAGDTPPRRSVRSVKEQVQANRAAFLQRQHRR